MDPHLTKVLKHFESFQVAFSNKDYDACTVLLSQLMEILVEKASQEGTTLSKTLAVTDHTEEPEEQELEDTEEPEEQEPEEQELLGGSAFGNKLDAEEEE